jgi:hypothetical protein
MLSSLYSKKTQAPNHPEIQPPFHDPAVLGLKNPTTTMPPKASVPHISKKNSEPPQIYITLPSNRLPIPAFQPKG